MERWQYVLWLCFTHLKQTLRQTEPDLRPQICAEEEQGDFGHGNVSVIQERPFGQLQPARATVPPCAQYDGGGSGDEVQVSRHGLQFQRPGVRGVTVHCGAMLKGPKRKKKFNNVETEGKTTPTEGEVVREAVSRLSV